MVIIRNDRLWHIASIPGLIGMAASSQSCAGNWVTRFSPEHAAASNRRRSEPG